MSTESAVFIHAVYGSTWHKLLHHRLCHSGKFCTDNIDKVVDGVPCLGRRNPFFSCHSCSAGEMTEKIKGYATSPIRATQPGGRFIMDYGFVRGKVVIKKEDVPLITIKEDYNCYLLIVDKYSRHLWVLLFASNSPPADTTTTFVNIHGLRSGICYVRTDQRGELAKSAIFRKSISEVGYVL